MNKVNKMNFKPPDREILIELYINQQKTMHDISLELGIAQGTVYNYLRSYGIDRRKPHNGFAGKHHSKETKDYLKKVHLGRICTDESKRKMSESKKIGGVGHKKKRQDGYIYIYFPDHPKSSKDGYIMEHDLVMECLIGRHLKEDEVVHHKNGIRDDNKKENLQLMTKSEHMSYHSKKRHEQNNYKKGR